MKTRYKGLYHGGMRKKKLIRELIAFAKRHNKDKDSLLVLPTRRGSYVW